MGGIGLGAVAPQHPLLGPPQVSSLYRNFYRYVHIGHTYMMRLFWIIIIEYISLIADPIIIDATDMLIALKLLLNLFWQMKEDFIFLVISNLKLILFVGLNYWKKI